MDASIASKHLRQLHLCIEENSLQGEPAGGFAGRAGDAWVVIDPTSTGAFPSNNRNRVSFFGVNERVTAEQLDALILRFRAAKIERFFFWLSPSKQSSEIEAWLLARKFTRWTKTGYPTLSRPLAPVVWPQTNLIVRNVSADEATQLREPLGEVYGGFSALFFKTIGYCGHEHFVAFDQERPVAAAILTTCEDSALLWLMGTRESDRRRGAQNALIAARVNAALQRGCKYVYSETLYFLEGSLRNLERNGFKEVYEKKVYMWTRPK